MKKLDKILSVFLIVLVLSTITLNVFAQFSLDQVTSNKDLGDADATMTNIGSFILTLVTNVGMILAVVVIAVLGVKYMMGSAEEKAEYKKTLIPYFVGAVLVFGASAIGRFVITAGQKVAAGGAAAGNS